MPLRPEMTADVYFKRTDEGGKAKAIRGEFRTILEHRGKNFDCRFSAEEVGGLISPGERHTLSIQFLSPDLALAGLSPGSRFDLWEGGKYAVGTVLEILTRENPKNP